MDLERFAAGKAFFHTLRERSIFMKTKCEVVQYYVVFTDRYDNQDYRIFFNEESALDFLDYISDKSEINFVKLLRLDKLSSVDGI